MEAFTITLLPPQIDQSGLGFRVPTLVISPWAKHNYIDHTQYEFSSMLSLAEHTFNLPSLGVRDVTANDMMNSFDFNNSPQPTLIEPANFVAETPIPAATPTPFPSVTPCPSAPSSPSSTPCSTPSPPSPTPCVTPSHTTSPSILQSPKPSLETNPTLQLITAVILVPVLVVLILVVARNRVLRRQKKNSNPRQFIFRTEASRWRSGTPSELVAD